MLCQNSFSQLLANLHAPLLVREPMTATAVARIRGSRGASNPGPGVRPHPCRYDAGPEPVPGSNGPGGAAVPSPQVETSDTNSTLHGLHF